MNDELNKLYTALIGKGYTTDDLGDENTFRSMMSDKNNRKDLYDWVSSRGDFKIGIYENYENRLSQPTATEQNAFEGLKGMAESQGVTMPVDSTLPTENRNQDIFAGRESMARYADSAQNLRKAQAAYNMNPTAENAEQLDSAAMNFSNVETSRLDAEKEKRTKEELLAERKRLEDAKKEVELRLRTRRGEITSPSGMYQMGMAPVTGNQATEITDPEMTKLYAAVNSYDNAIRSVDRKLSGEEPGFWEGVADATVRNPGFYTMGLTDMSDARGMLNIAQNGVEGREDELLADALYSKNAEQQDEDFGFLYRAGNMFGHSVPFMVQTAVTGGFSGASRAGANLAGRLGKKAAEGTIKKKIINAMGTTIDDVIEAGLIANTAGAGGTWANIADRKAGKINIKDGDYVFENGESWLGALYKGEVSSILELYTEKLGGHLEGKLSLTKGLDKIGASRVSNVLLAAKNSDLYKGASTVMRQFGLNGYLPEVLEEEANLVLNSLLVGDNSLSELYNPKTQLDIFGGMLLTVGTMQAIPGTIATAGYVKNQYQMSRADRRAADVFGEDWEAVKEALDNATNEKVAGVVSENLRDNVNQNEALLDYYKRMMIMRGYNIGTVKNETAPEVEEAYTDGFSQEPTGANALNAMTGYDIARQEVARALGLAEGDDVDVFLNGRTAEDIAKGDTDVENAVKNYQQQKARMEGVQEKFQQTREQQYEESDRSIDSNANKANPDMTYSTTYKGEEVFIRNGNVVLNEDGTIDVNNSSETLYVKFSDGHVEMTSPDKFTEVFTSDRTADLKAAKRAEIDAKWKAEFDTAEAQSVEQEKREAGVVFDKADAQGNHRIEILNEGEDMSNILFDGAETEISTDELNQWKQEAGVQSTDTVADDITDNGIPVGLKFEHNGELIEVLDNGYPLTRVLIDGEEVRIGSATLAMWVEEAGLQKENTAADDITGNVAPTESEANVAPTGDNVTPVETAAPKTALEQIPRNEKNVPMYEQVDSELAWDGVVEEAGGNEETAMVAVNSMVEDKKKALAAAEKAKAKAGATITEKIAAENERVANIEKAKADLAKWEEIAGVKAKRQSGSQAEAVQAESGVAPIEAESKPVVETLSTEEARNEESPGITFEEYDDAEYFIHAVESKDPTRLQEYLDNFPEGAYRDGARAVMWMNENGGSHEDMRAYIVAVGEARKVIRDYIRQRTNKPAVELTEDVKTKDVNQSENNLEMVAQGDAPGNGGVQEITNDERVEMEARIVDWLSEDNLERASGKTRDEIFDEFGNELEPIAYIPTQYISLVSQDLKDQRIYCGKGYFIDHALRNHAKGGKQLNAEDVDVSKYLNIQSVLDNPDSVKETYVDGKRTVVFIKKIGRYFAELTQVEEDGKIVLHKSMFDQKKEPYAKLDDIRSKGTSSEGGVSSISHTAGAAPAISLESRGDVVSNSTESSASEDRNSVSNSQENTQKSGEIAENGGENASVKTIFSSAFKDLVSEDGKYNIRITKVDGAKRVVTANINTANMGGEGLVLSFEEMADILNSGNWQEKIAPESTNPSGNRLVTDERYAELRERMRKKLKGQMNIGIDPEILAIGTEMAVYHIEKGARKFADFAMGMIDDLGDAIRPYLKAFYNGARELPEIEEAGFTKDMTPYEEVKTFDVANFDKPTVDAMATAETVTREAEVAKDVETVKAPKKSESAEGKKLRKASQEDLEGNPVVYYKGEKHRILMLIHRGEQTAGGRFTKPEITRVYLENMQDVKVDDLYVEDTKENVGESGDNSVPSQQTPVNNLNENNDGREENTATDNSGARLEREELSDTEQVGTGTPVQNTARNSRRKRRNAGVGSSELGNGPQYDVNRNYTNEEIETIVSSVTGIVDGKVVITGEVTDDIKAIVHGYESGGIAKKGRGILDEYYTDGKIVDAVNLLIAPYFNSSTPIRVLEPSVGIGNFIQAVNNIPTSEVVAFEINETTARIAKILYPDVDVNLRSFETEFIDESGNKKPIPQKYSLVIGNPPYGSHRGLYKGLGEESKIARYEDYFVKRSLDVLDEGGVLAMVLPSSWMDRHTKFGGYTIERAYRLPSGAFEATQVGTDIVILKKDSSVPVTEHIPYFEQFPERVLGEVKQRKGRYGRLEEYVEGDIDAAIEAIKKENAEQVADLLDIEKNNDALNDIESAVDETGSPEKAVAIVKDAQESEKADKKPAKKPSGKQGKYKVELNRGVETVPTSAQFTHEFSEGEVEAFADTDYEGALSNPAKHRRYANYIGGQAIHDFYYAEGDIYSKLAQLEQEKDYIVENYGVEQYEKQKALLESVLPKQKSLEEITISPNTTFVKNLNILTEGGRVSLKDMFVDFLRKLPRQAFGNSSPWEVVGYINNEQVHGTDKQRNQLIRERRKRVANDLFNKFLSDELSDNAKKQVVAAFNREYNSTYRPDYSKVPMFSTINRDFKGKPLKLTSVQLAGIGRMTVKGVGVLAHEVGFGKTLSGILAMHEAMTRGFAKKPLIVVPNDNILKQWVETIGEVLPNATINILGNLGAGYDLTDFKVNEGEFTIITYEGLKAMSFSDGTYNHLASKFSYITEDLNKHQSERDIQKRLEKTKELKGKMKRGTKSSYMFEDFGFDWLTVDEVHNANHIVSKVRLDKSVASDFRSQSQRTSDLGLKTWLAAQYIQEENNGRNVLLLSATPFTNKPLEYYSILSLVGNDMLERKGFFNVDQFFATFMEADNELEIGANGRPTQKTNVRRFRNNGLFQQLLSEFIDIKGEEDNPELVRPERLNKEYKIAQNELTAEAMAAAQELLSDNDTVLQGIGHARAAAFSPYATSLLGVQPKNHKEFVKNSPKIDATIKMIEQNIKDRPDAGQIVYSEVGVEFFPLIRDYLVKESGLKPNEVRIITGATSNNERVNIQSEFNDGKVKVVIGSPAIKEGLNLQGNTTDMYILSLPWNFTQLRQIEGRGWRQGNKWENIRINYMLTNDSVDVFMLQRLQLKQGLYNEAMKSGAESLDVSDIDTAELKTALITDPAVRAEIVTVQERAKLQQEKTQIEADLSFVMRKYEAYNKLVEKLGSQKNTIKMYREWAKKGDEYWAQRIPREEAQLANIENEIEEEKQSLLKKGVNVDDIVSQTEQAQNDIVAIQEKIDNLKEFQEELTQRYREENEAKAKEQGDLISTYIKERKAENKGFYKIRPAKSETKTTEEDAEDGVTPSLRAELEKRGVPFVNTNNRGKPVSTRPMTKEEARHMVRELIVPFAKELREETKLKDAERVINEFNKAHKGATKKVVVSKGKETLVQQMRDAGFTDLSIEVAMRHYEGENDATDGAYYVSSDGIVIYDTENLDITLWHENTHRAIQIMFGGDLSEVQTVYKELPDYIKEDVSSKLNANKYSEEDIAEEAVCFFVEEVYAGGLLQNGNDNIEGIFGEEESSIKDFAKFAQRLIDYINYGEDYKSEGVSERVSEELRESAIQERNSRSDKNGEGIDEAAGEEEDTRFRREVEDVIEQQQENEVSLAREAATSLGEKLKSPVKIMDNLDSVPENRRKWKGWFDPKTGEVVVVMPNHVSTEDAVQTVLHEVVGHKGLRAVLGEDFDVFLDGVYKNASPKVKRGINDRFLNALKNGPALTVREATEEYIAELAERDFEGYRDTWNAIRQWFRNFFRNFMNMEITDGELRYLLWKNYNRMKSGPIETIIDRAMEANTGTGKVMARTAETYSAVDAYNKSVKGFKNKFKEGWYDEMRSLKKAQEAIEKELGREIMDSENVYLYANHIPSINKNKKEVFDNKYLRPFTSLLKQLYRKEVNGKKLDEKAIERYTNAKHGIERNREMSVKNALTEAKDGQRVFNDNAYKSWAQERDEVRKKNLPWAEEQRELDKVAEKYGAKIRDYSGLTAIFDTEKKLRYKKIADAAYQYVADVDKALRDDVNKLWGLLKGMTDYSLNEAFESGMMSKSTYEHIKQMYRYYVPLRGFTEQTAEDFFDYVEGDHSPLNAVVKTAYGRKSEADNIFATILNMANSAIVQGSKNRLKQRLLNLAMRSQTGLLSVDNAWYEKKGDTYEPVKYPENANEYADFEERMKDKEKRGEVVRHRPGLDIGWKVAETWNKTQHAVRVKRNGREYVVWVNGDPAMANAINGLLREEIGGAIKTVNQFRSKMVTQYSPTFVFTNLLRDVQSASIIYAVRRGTTMFNKFKKNVASNATDMMDLYLKHKRGTLDVNNPKERYFKEFLENGGETGYTEMISIEEYEKKLKELTKGLNMKNGTRRAFKAVGGAVDFANRCVENLCRFSAYQTSRKAGISVLKSIEDAKEVSVNFNRKGSGAMGQKYAKAGFMFLNPAVQSIAQRILLTKKYPKKMAAVWAGEFILGAAIPVLYSIISAALGDDDDEITGNYYNLSDYRRRSSLCLPLKDGVFHIPLSHESRVLFGLGELCTSFVLGHEKLEDVPIEALNTLAQSLPLNPVEGWMPGKNIIETMTYNFMPDAVKPIAEVVMNRDFAGNTIHNRTDFNEFMPEYMRGKRGTLGAYKKISKYLTSTDGYEKSFLNDTFGALFNPSVMEHLVEGYLGGLYTFGEKALKAGAWAFGNEEYAEFRNIPIASSFYTSLAKYEDTPKEERTRRDWENAFRFYKDEVKNYDDKEKTVKNGLKHGEEGADLVLEQMERNGEVLMVDIFNDGNDRLKELYGASDAARKNRDFKRVEDIDQQIYAEKRNIVSQMEQLADDPMIGYTFKRNKIEGPYGERETYGDVRDAKIINDIQKELKPLYEAYKDAYDWGDNTKEEDLWYELDDIERDISDATSEMKDYPEEADELMAEIRKMRAKAMELINNNRKDE